MKVIDLLNKIANGEKVEGKHEDLYIKYFGRTNFNNRDEFRIESHCGLTIAGLLHILNDEIEIIEEPKKIEKLENRIDESFENATYSERMRLTEIVNKLNEIIDYINRGE